MGQGIVGLIPIKLTLDKGHQNDISTFSEGYFSYFDCIEDDGVSLVYEIKKEIIFENFKNYFLQFNKMIHSPIWQEIFWIDSYWPEFEKHILNDDFTTILNDLEKLSNTEIPFFCGTYNYVTDYDMKVNKSIVFYEGSYKAYLEDYSTLIHMHRLLKQALKNPLSEITRFCLFG